SGWRAPRGREGGTAGRLGRRPAAELERGADRPAAQALEQRPGRDVALVHLRPDLSLTTRLQHGESLADQPARDPAPAKRVPHADEAELRVLGPDPHTADADVLALHRRDQVDGWIEVGREKGLLAEVGCRPAPAVSAGDVLPQLV